MNYSIIFIIITILIYLFTFLNGIKDGPNAIATIVASRSIKAEKALIIAAIMEFIAPFLTYLIGFSVADTVAHLINIDFSKQFQNLGIVFLASAVFSAVVWNLLMVKLKLPASSSHSLIGSLIGAGIVAYGLNNIDWTGFLLKVILVMFSAPFIGFITGYIIMKITDYITVNSHPDVNKFFIRAQGFNMVFLSLNHSLNDSQKSIGIVMLLYMLCFNTVGTSVPIWIVGTAGLMLALGILIGGFRIITTIGNGIYRIRPKHSFSSQLSSSLVILVSTFLGAPVSTSQIVSSSIMGVGSAQKIKSVRWLVVKKILLSWVLTIPAAAVFGGSLYYLGSLIML